MFDQMKKWFDISAAGFALVAAAFWFLSAYGKLPPMVTYWGGAPDADPFYQSVKFSAVMNTCAAIFSGASAFCMGMKLFIRG
jgi:hypothetical protein